MRPGIRLTKKRECRRLTLTGWLLVLFVITSLSFLFIRYVHNYLSLNNPIKSKILVIDGMFPGYVYDSLVKIINRDKYEIVVTTGIETDYVFSPEDNFNTAEISYKILKKKDLKNCRLEKAPAGAIVKNRTYNSALTLKNWLKQNDLEGNGFNIASFGAHSRRTHILYKKVFKDIDIGMISIRDVSYNPVKWYKYARGMRMVLSETITCVFVKLFFFPKSGVTEKHEKKKKV